MITKVYHEAWDSKLIFTKEDLQFAENPNLLAKRVEELQKMQKSANLLAVFAKNKKKKSRNPIIHLKYTNKKMTKPGMMNYE